MKNIYSCSRSNLIVGTTLGMITKLSFYKLYRIQAQSTTRIRNMHICTIPHVANYGYIGMKVRYIQLQLGIYMKVIGTYSYIFLKEVNTKNVRIIT